MVYIANNMELDQTALGAVRSGFIMFCINDEIKPGIKEVKGTINQQPCKGPVKQKLSAKIVISSLSISLNMCLECSKEPSIIYILREKSLSINLGDSQFRRNRIYNVIISKIFVDKHLRVQ